MPKMSLKGSNLFMPVGVRALLAIRGTLSKFAWCHNIMDDCSISDMFKNSEISSKNKKYILKVHPSSFVFLSKILS